MKVIGIKKSEFDTQDGKHISGYSLHCTYPMDKGDGEGVERIFMTTEKLLNCKYSPSVGDEINVEYNRFGKPAAISLVG